MSVPGARSLLVVGSCSRALQSIIELSGSAFSKITIADLLPHYDLHRRFYRLQRRLKDNKSNTEISISKLTQI